MPELCGKEKIVEGMWVGTCRKPVGHKSECFKGCETCDHEEALPVSDSVLDAVHGFVRRLCRCCLVKESEELLEKVAKSAAERRADLEVNPCR